MSFLPFIHFFCLVCNLYLMIFVLVRNPKSRLNQACAILLGSFIIWNFGMIFTHNIMTPMNMAKFFYNLSSIGWISFSSAFVYFTLIFTKKDKTEKAKRLYPFLIIIPILFIYKQWDGKLIRAVIISHYGWAAVWSTTIWPYLFYLYYLCFIGTGLYQFAVFEKGNKSEIQVKQTRVLFASVLPPLVLGSLTSIIMPLLKIRVVPNIADILTLCWALGLSYITLRHRFLSITPAMAADNIISTMVEFMVILEPDWKINALNKSFTKSTGYQIQELRDTGLEKIFVNKEDLDNLKSEIVQKKSIENFSANIIMKNKGEIPVIISGSALKDEYENIAGFVLIARNVSELKKAEEEKNNLIEELQDSLDKIKKLKGLLPICARCKKIRNDEGKWDYMESYIEGRSQAKFSHGFCPECAVKEIASVKQILKEEEE